jgi:hypothetical protein
MYSWPRIPDGDRAAGLLAQLEKAARKRIFLWTPFFDNIYRYEIRNGLCSSRLSQERAMLRVPFSRDRLRNVDTVTTGG